MKIEVTADWILSKLTNTMSRGILDDFGDLTVCADGDSYYWVELVFDQLEIENELIKLDGELWFAFKYTDLLEHYEDFPDFIDMYHDLYPEMNDKRDMYMTINKFLKKGDN